MTNTEKVDGLSLNLATVREQWDMRQAVEGCLRCGIRAIAPWRDQVAKIGICEASKLVRDNELQVTGLCRGGFFTHPDGPARQAALDDNFQAIDEAAELGADCLVLVVGGLPDGSRDLAGAHQMIVDGIAAIMPRAVSSGVPIAIEPLHPMYAADRASINTLRHALDICEHIGEPTLGVAIDVYHVWWDPELADQIARAGQAKRILAHHICDWLSPTRHMLTDRGMMGDGVIELRKIRALIEKAGFNGPQEVEIFSADNWWKRPGDKVVSTCRDRYFEHCLVE